MLLSCSLDSSCPGAPVSVSSCPSDILRLGLCPLPLLGWDKSYSWPWHLGLLCVAHWELPWSRTPVPRVLAACHLGVCFWFVWEAQRIRQSMMWTGTWRDTAVLQDVDRFPQEPVREAMRGDQIINKASWGRPVHAVRWSRCSVQERPSARCETLQDFLPAGCPHLIQPEGSPVPFCTPPEMLFLPVSLPSTGLASQD